MNMSELEFSWPAVGHQNIKNILRRGLINGRPAHAYLFYGQENVGKMETAEFFAESVLCEEYKKYLSAPGRGEKTILPCGACPTCRQFRKKTHADYHVVRREVSEKTGEKKGIISVTQIRELLDKISKRAFLNSYKIVIIPEAESLNQEASNCLLKTLEEPAPRTIIILICVNKDLLLGTILSRCQQFKFLPVTRDEIRESLLADGASRPLANELSRVAMGRPAVARRFFRQRELWQEHQEIQRQFWRLLSADNTLRFKMIDELFSKDKSDDELTTRLDCLSGLARDLLLARFYNEEWLANDFLSAEIKDSRLNLSPRRLKIFIGAVEQTKKNIRENVNPRLAVENLIFNL